MVVVVAIQVHLVQLSSSFLLLLLLLPLPFCIIYKDTERRKEGKKIGISSWKNPFLPTFLSRFLPSLLFVVNHSGRKIGL